MPPDAWQLQQLARYGCQKSEQQLTRYLKDTGFCQLPQKQKDELGCRALRTAAWRGYANLVSILLEAGVSPDARREQERTALMQAAESGCWTVTAQLLEAGANRNAKDGEDCTALYLATINKHESVGKLLKVRSLSITGRKAGDGPVPEDIPNETSAIDTTQPDETSPETQSVLPSAPNTTSVPELASFLLKVKKLQLRTTFKRIEPDRSEFKVKCSIRGYNWSTSFPGLAIILTVDEFLQPQHNVPEFQTNTDELTKTLQDMNFRVRPLRNLPAAQVVPKMKEILDKEQQLGEAGCVYIHIMSHGHLNKIYGSDMRLLELRDVTALLKTYDAFKKKPKILVIDTCQTNTQQAVSDENFSVISDKDFFVLYATRWGQRAWVFPEIGALCTHKVIECLQQYGVQGRRMQGKQTGLLRTIDQAGEKADAYLQKYNLDHPDEAIDQLCVVIKTTYAKELYFPRTSAHRSYLDE